MTMTKVSPVSKELHDDPPPHKRGCKSAHILLVLFVLFLAGLASACVVVGAVPLYRCQTIMLLDVWLIAHGVSALGALVGLMLWSSKMATGKFVNGPKIFALLLISLNFIWLILGTALVIGAYVSCETPTFLGTISCSSGYLHFALVIVIIFLIAYIAFFILLGLAFASKNHVKGWTHPALGETGCCARPSCLSSFYVAGDAPSWQEWVIIIALISYTLLAITAIALGSAFIGTCDADLWMPYWLIVNGVVTLSLFLATLCWLGFPGWVEVSWARTNFVAFLPLFILCFFLMLWLTFGNVRAAEFKINDCPAADICNDGLQAFTFIYIYLLDLPFLVIVYIGIIFTILITILLMISCCYKTCQRVDIDTAPPAHPPAKNDSTSTTSSADSCSCDSDSD